MSYLSVHINEMHVHLSLMLQPRIPYAATPRAAKISSSHAEQNLNGAMRTTSAELDRQSTHAAKPIEGTWANTYARTSIAACYPQAVSWECAVSCVCAISPQARYYVAYEVLMRTPV